MQAPLPPLRQTRVRRSIDQGSASAAIPVHVALLLCTVSLRRARVYFYGCCDDAAQCYVFTAVHFVREPQYVNFPYDAINNRIGCARDVFQAGYVSKLAGTDRKALLL